MSVATYTKQKTLKDITIICTIRKDGAEKQETAVITTGDTSSDVVREALKSKFDTSILAYKVEKIELTKEKYLQHVG